MKGVAYVAGNAHSPEQPGLNSFVLFRGCSYRYLVFSDVDIFPLILNFNYDFVDSSFRYISLSFFHIIISVIAGNKGFIDTSPFLHFYVNSDITSC